MKKLGKPCKKKYEFFHGLFPSFINDVFKLRGTV